MTTGQFPRTTLLSASKKRGLRSGPMATETRRASHGSRELMRCLKPSTDRAVSKDGVSVAMRSIFSTEKKTTAGLRYTTFKQNREWKLRYWNTHPLVPRAVRCFITAPLYQHSRETS